MSFKILKNEKVVSFLRDSKQKYDDLFPKAILEMFNMKQLYKLIKIKYYSRYLYVNYDGKETCNLIFCDICNKEYKNNHQRKSEDIDSIAFLKTITQCPTWNTSIEKK